MVWNIGTELRKVVQEMSDDSWSGMFDFNGDGHTDAGEQWTGYQIYKVL